MVEMSGVLPMDVSVSVRVPEVVMGHIYANFSQIIRDVVGASFKVGTRVGLWIPEVDLVEAVRAKGNIINDEVRLAHGSERESDRDSHINSALVRLSELEKYLQGLKIPEIVDPLDEASIGGMELLRVRCTEDFKGRLYGISFEHEMSMSEWVRDTLIGYLELGIERKLPRRSYELCYIINRVTSLVMQLSRYWDDIPAYVPAKNLMLLNAKFQMCMRYSIRSGKTL